MPRLVDHDGKREEIIRATWRLIAERGFESATMREIAAASGHANGALSHYFRNKDELLQAAYLFVWEETNARIASRLEGVAGLDAVRVYWDEIAPGSAVAVMEARIVLPFFARTGTDPVVAGLTTHTLDRWRTELAAHLEQARSDGQITAGTPTPVLVEQLLTMLMGLQIFAGLAAPPDHSALFDALLAALR